MKSGLKKILNNVLKDKTDSTKKMSPLKKYLILGIILLSVFLIIIVSIITVLFAALMIAQQFVEDVKNDVSLFFEKTGNLLTLNGWCADSDGSCQKKAEQKYYEKLNDVYNDYNEKGIEIDTELITATIFYSKTLSDETNVEEETEESDELSELDSDTDIHLGDVKKLASYMVNGNSLDYTKYRNYLIDTYIPKRFSNMYYEQDAEKSIENIADEIMSFASLKEGSGSGNFASNCSFNEQEKTQINIDKEYVNSIQINILLPYYHNFYTENASESDIEYTVSLKEYVTGVVYREIRAGINPMSEETIKANIVAIKSYTLDRHPTIQKNGKYYINMRNNTDDQVYCKLDTGCEHYSSFGESNLLGPAPSSVKDLLYRLYDETSNEFIYDTSEKKFTGEYRSTKALCVSNSDPANCMSQNDSITMGNNGDDYKAILMSFYTQNTGLLDINNLTVSSGAYACNKTSYMGGGKYSSNAPRYDNSSDFFANLNYNYFQSASSMNDPWNIGQCPWYARGRAIEIIANSDMPENLKQERIDFLRNMKGNGEAWYRNLSDQLFSKSADIYAAKPGSIVSWSGGSTACSPRCGHVGIIEDVEYDSNGRATRVLLSDGWNKGTVLSTAGYGYRWMDINQLSVYNLANPNYYSGLNGYVYLLD